MNYLFIDFEYNTSQNEFLNLVCCSYSVTNKDFTVMEKDSIWLYGAREQFKPHLEEIRGRYPELTVVCWSANAEGRSFLAGGVDPRSLPWIDLQAEYKMILNHNHTYMYGKQLIKGKEVTTVPPSSKYGMSEELQKQINASKPESNLAAATYKLLDIKIDTKHKTFMRDIIIENNDEKINAHKTQIMEYCDSDIKYLPQLLVRILGIYKRLNSHSKCGINKEEILWRGRSVLNTAIMENNGYPVNEKWATNFTKNVPHILRDLADDIKSQFPEGESPFAEDTKPARNQGYVRSLTVPRKRIKYWKEWISKNCNVDKWVKTGKYHKVNNPLGLSTALDAWQRYFKVPSNTYEEGNFAHQIVRFLKVNQQLNGFLPAQKGKSKFIDFIGDDERARGYLNSYGSQSARWQPKAVSFLFLKSAWMRSMCTPKAGKFICGIDYSQQEFLIMALMSKDTKMIEAYQTGDVYLHTGKLAGKIPQGGTKKSHPKDRDTYKAVTLAINYLMSCYGLSDTLTQSLKRVVDEDEAQRFIDDYYKVYHKSKKYMDQKIIAKYEIEKYLKLADGYVLFGNNSNFRSYGNFLMQGMGSCILRKAVDMAIDAGFKLVFPLHDALYFEGDVENKEEQILAFDEIMKQAFSYYFEDKKQAYDLIRTDIDIWGPDLENAEIKIGNKTAKSQPIYVDPRGAREHELFKKYMYETVTNDPMEDQIIGE